MSRHAFALLLSNHPPRCFDNNYWYEGIHWEPTVRYALNDLLRTGDIAFDCGANVGGLSTIMSRLVGQRGFVCAFEASPRVIGHLQYNLVLQGCSNTTVYHRAIVDSSGATIHLKFNPKHHHSDHIVADNTGDTMVSTLALDDFVNETGLVPNLVKMDIEGAEEKALRGFMSTIRTHKPHFILESGAGHPLPFSILREQGYLCWDLANYSLINVFEDLGARFAVKNLLFIHPTRIGDTPYRETLSRQIVTEFSKTDFYECSHGKYLSKTPILLEPGRYHFELNFVSDGMNDQMACGVCAENKKLIYYQTYSNFLSTSYSDWVLDLWKPERLQIFFNFLRGTYEPSFRIDGAKIYRVPELSKRRILVDAVV